MIKRLLYGLVFGLFVGAVVAAAIIKGLGMLSFAGTGGTVLAYVFAAVTGVLVGLVAGKPIWASGGQIEAGLKAFFGALLASGAMFVLRRWVHVDLDLHGMGAGPDIPTAVGYLPAVSLPLISAVLGAFYEADNTPEPAGEKGKDARDEKSAAGKKNAKLRVAAGVDGDDALEEDEAPARKAKK